MGQAPLPSENRMTRDDALDAFLTVVNAVEPEHPHYNSPYPVDREDINFGWTRNCFARCGPAKGNHKINYSTRMTYINKISRERHLALITHEIAHISSPSKVGFSNHPPEFWLQMSKYALQILDKLENGDLRESFPEANTDTYQTEVVQDPNSETVDRRYWSVADCKKNIEAFLDGDPDAFQDYIQNEGDYDSLPEDEKRITTNLTESTESTERLVDLPGIGEQTVLKIGSEYDHAEEMVNRLKLVEPIKEIVSSQYHDDLWYKLRIAIDRQFLPEQGRLPIPSPDRSIYFENGKRRIPSKSEFRQHTQ